MHEEPTNDMKWHGHDNTLSSKRISVEYEVIDVSLTQSITQDLQQSKLLYQ